MPLAPQGMQLHAAALMCHPGVRPPNFPLVGVAHLSSGNQNPVSFGGFDT